MSRTCPPCSSSGPPYPPHVPPVSDGQRPGPPCRPRLPLYSPETFPGLSLRARCETLPSTSLHLFGDLLQILWHWCNGLAGKLHVSVGALSHHNVKRPILLVFVRIIITEMSATALFAVQSRVGNHLRHGQKVRQVECGMPSGVVFPVPAHTHPRSCGGQFANALLCLQHLLLRAHNSHQVLHQVLQGMLHGVRIFRAVILEGPQGRFLRGSQLTGVHCSEWVGFGEVGSVFAGTLTEYQQVRE